MGAVGLVGGTLELLGSAALLVDPDPTASKVIGVVGIVPGSDVVSTSWEELRTGRSRTTATAQATAALARTLGLSPEDAARGGALVDIAIPTGVAAGVARAQSLTRLTRVGSVRNGYVSLVNEEQTFNVGKGAAHTIRDHVGKTTAQLTARFTAKRGQAVPGRVPVLLRPRGPRRRRVAGHPGRRPCHAALATPPDTLKDHASRYR